MRDTPFFIGFLPPSRWFLALYALAGVAMVLGFGAVGWAIGLSQADPGDGAFRFDFGRQTVTGVIEARPYPMLHVTEGTEAIPAGRTIIMSGGGKTGVQSRADPLDGQLATVSGAPLQRGDLTMIQARGGRNGVGAAEEAAESAVPEVAVTDLGRWRLAGEICDGKCLAGAMRPGTGLAHRACANFCLIGGVPPVFVSSQPVEGESFLLLGGPDGGPLPEVYLDYTALYVSVEGRLERRGDLLVFLIDPDTLEIL
ncbi:MAG: hypothetical protein AAGE76_00170 [Pseudomonadota bacterium]